MDRHDCLGSSFCSRCVLAYAAIVAALTALLPFAVMSCSPVRETPTGRTQLTIYSQAEIDRAGLDAFERIKREKKLITAGPRYDVLRHTGLRVAAASSMPELPWEFVLIDDPGTANAFSIPGGKVAVYTGMFPILQNEGALAALLGHEAAHVTARHANERASQSALRNMLLSQIADDVNRTWMAVFGLGTTVGILLPFSRTHEREADEIGLRMMALAGYDPSEAPLLWDRMDASNARGVPTFLSTHPDPVERAQRLRELLASAREIHRAAPIKIPSRLLP